MAEWIRWSLGLREVVAALLSLAAIALIGTIHALRGRGPTGYHELLRAATAGSTLRDAALLNIGAGLLTAAGAFALWYVTPDSAHDWAFWFAVGLLLHAIGNTVSRLEAAQRAFRVSR